ncbi:Rpn family recombination-promoting nuclease/putative transposase [Pedobacter hartonius]|uniref:Uncharacterized protein n=1 Tax=Pedobacter hartonius TaxID=425514 RepID=A0A1H4BPT7_9SPHI|nr:Rpn family recombination-promoting nuclease/putative transposase [Pedobacter hartonius]SEA50139.1 conserved hypothetical protein (putative transposase or invertase) [Pedobacter hartonius]
MKQEQPRYIDPLMDFSFKKIFGDVQNKDLLLSLLNALFRGRKHIVDLEFNKNDHPGNSIDEGGAIFDVLCTGDRGEKFLIEVQRSKQEQFMKRALFYTSRQISGQAPKGKRKEWKYAISEVYLVAILCDFRSDIGLKDRYLRRILLCDADSGEIFHEEFGFLFIELCNFNKMQFELDTILDKWLFALKNMSELRERPSNFNEPIFEKLFDMAEYTNFTRAERSAYEMEQKRRWDNYAVMEYAKKQASEKGMQEGFEKGMKEGEQKKALDVAIELKKNGVPTELISKATQLNIPEIEAL